ncbi:hypothetical protein NUW54_g4868 [Trametes sanguinea]|uniref:Uncharacterized protein n=1 Tax=Trametes sanguinea TaxID=158606 RepID=A0ACC1PXS5_9APHY|nr:hypothetical protein NUW54_g4868 [Trametes sanguinea]
MASENVALHKDPVTGEMVSKTELKRREKAREREAKKAEKAAAAPPKPAAAPKSSAADEENLSPNVRPPPLRARDPHSPCIAAILRDPLQTHPKAPRRPRIRTRTPHKFHVSISITDYIEKYGPAGKIEAGQKLEGVTECLAGRIHNVRASGQNLRFYDLHGEGTKVQIMAAKQDAKDPENFVAAHEHFRRGDIVGVIGTPARTKKGELSIAPSEMILLAPNLHQLPSAHFGLKDQETRYRKRYLDLIMNEDTRRIFITRSRIINYVRRFLDNLGFLESRRQ